MPTPPPQVLSTTARERVIDRKMGGAVDHGRGAGVLTQHIACSARFDWMSRDLAKLRH
jgi:hypothetical protein